MAVTSYVFGGTRSCFFFMEGIFFLFLLLISIHPTVTRTKHNQVFVVTNYYGRNLILTWGFHLQTYFNWSTIHSTPAPGWALKWLNVITRSRWRTTESGSVTWLGTRPPENPLGGSSSKMHDFKHIGFFLRFSYFALLLRPSPPLIACKIFQARISLLKVVKTGVAHGAWICTGAKKYGINLTEESSFVMKGFSLIEMFILKSIP